MIRERVSCVVLAGGEADEQVKQRYNVRWRAQVPLAGVSMLERVVRSVRDSGSVSRIVVVGEFPGAADAVVPPGGTFLESVMNGLEGCPDADQVLVTSCDIPLAPPEAFRALVEDGLKLEADFVYPVLRREECERKYPEFRRTWLRVREGTFTGGNAVLVSRNYALQSRGRIEDLYQARKTPLKLASMIGIPTLLRVALAQKLWAGAVSIPSIERAGERAMGGKLRALVSSWPELGEDLDHPEDFEVAERLLSGGG